jgi:type IV pilus assembly protein PilW
MFSLSRDLALAGYGFGRAGSAEMGCTVTALNANSVSANFTMLPVEIIHGASSAPDTIRTLYGNSAYFTDMQTVTSSTSTTKSLKSRIGVNPGDLVIITDGATSGTANCALIEVTGWPSSSLRAIEHLQTSYVSAYVPATATASPSRFNPITGTGATFVTGNAFNLGPAPKRNVWSIRAGGVLTVADTIAGTPAVDVAEGIVDLQAEYGVAGSPMTWTGTMPADPRTVRAVRVAILSRSQQFEKIAPTTAAVPFFGGSRTFNMANVFGASTSNVTGDPNNWRHYRYRVSEQVVPLKNAIMGTL